MSHSNSRKPRIAWVSSVRSSFLKSPFYFENYFGIISYYFLVERWIMLTTSSKMFSKEITIFVSFCPKLWQALSDSTIWPLIWRTFFRKGKPTYYSIVLQYVLNCDEISGWRFYNNICSSHHHTSISKWLSKKYIFLFL